MVVRDIAIGPDGVVWVASELSGVARYDGAAWTVHGSAEGPPFGELHAFTVAGRSVWAASRDGWLARFDGSDWTVVEHPDAPSSLSLAARADGSVWAGAVSNGVYRYTPYAPSSTRIFRAISFTSAETTSRIRALETSDVWVSR